MSDFFEEKCCCGAEITTSSGRYVNDFIIRHAKCTVIQAEVETRDARIAELESIVEQLKRQVESNTVDGVLDTTKTLIQVTSLHNGNTARFLASYVYGLEEFDYQAGGEPVKATRMYIDGGNRFDAVEPYEEVYLKLGWPVYVGDAASSTLPDDMERCEACDAVVPLDTVRSDSEGVNFCPGCFDEEVGANQAEDDVAEVGVSGGVVVPYPASSRKCCLCGFAFKTDQPHLVVNDCLYYCQSCYDAPERVAVLPDASEVKADRVRQIIDDVDVDSGFDASGRDTAKGQQPEHKCAKCEHVFAMTEACEKVGDDCYCFPCYDRNHRAE